MPNALPPYGLPKQSLRYGSFVMATCLGVLIICGCKDRDVNHAAIGDFKENINTGWSKIELGEFDNAITEFDTAIKLKPHSHEAFNGRGCTKLRLKEYDAAIRDFDKSLALDSGYAWPYNNRGLCYKEKGEAPTALADFDKAIERNPSEPEFYCNRACVNNDLGKHDLAISDCTSAIEMNPSFLKAYTQRRYAYSEVGDFDKALADCGEILQLKPECAWAVNLLGITYWESGKYEKAIFACGRAIQIDPTCTWAYNSRALARFDMGDAEGAMKDLNEAIRINPTLTGAIMNRGRVNLFLLRFEDAEKDFRGWQEHSLKYGSSYDAFSREIYISMARGGKDGRQELSSALSLTLQNDNRDNMRRYTVLDRMLLEEITPQQCLEAIKEEQSQPQTAFRVEAYYMIGQFWLIKGNPDKAIESFRDAVKTKLYKSDAYSSARAELRRLGVLVDKDESATPPQ